jgi:hypothetical protein
MDKDSKPDHFFVVTAVWSDEKNDYEFIVDDDTLVARFPEGVMWTEDGWRHPTDVDESERDVALSERLTNLLGTE